MRDNKSVKIFVKFLKVHLSFPMSSKSLKVLSQFEVNFHPHKDNFQILSWFHRQLSAFHSWSLQCRTILLEHWRSQKTLSTFQGLCCTRDHRLEDAIRDQENHLGGWWGESRQHDVLPPKEQPLQKSWFN